jgi:abortive infection bacteriophage resistance protein
MSLQVYNKPSLTYEEQLSQLKKRGMRVEDDEKALFYLQNCNYYRLTGYFYHFYKNSDNKEFQQEASFDKVIKAYEADRKLRILFMSVLEQIEVSVRANFAYLYSQQHSPLLFAKASHFKSIINNNQIGDLQKKICYEFNRSSELFAGHFKSKYIEPYPIWALVEIMSLGTLASLYKSLKPYKFKKDLAQIYNIKSQRVFESALLHLAVVRNICAHHSRLWNRNIDKQFEIPKNLPEVNQINNNSRRIYNTYLLIKHFGLKDSSGDDCSNNLKLFFEGMPEFSDKYGVIK